MATFTSNSAEETMALGESLAQVVIPDDVIVLNGDLGAGKTQFAKGFAWGLGVRNEVTSPTFNILIEYDDGRLPFFHFDLYRLDDEDDLEDVDFYDTLESGGVSLIEWGDKFPDALPDEYLEITVHAGDTTVRTLELVGHGDRGIDLESAMAG